MSFRKFIAAVLFVICNNVSALDLTSTVFDIVGKEKNIDPHLLYAVALAESAYSRTNDGTVAPYAFTLRTKNRPYYTNSRSEAEKLLSDLTKTNRSVDVGLMQINVKWHGHRVKEITDLLDTKTNLRIGADILNERLKANRNDWFKSISQYHSFDEEKGGNYARLVLSIYEKLLDDKPPVLRW